MKICVLIIFILLPWISKVGDWALGWTEGNARLQIAFVMMIFPLIMNALQYYIIDSFIKQKETNLHERLPSEDPDEHHGLRHEDADQGEELLTSSESEDDDEAKKSPRHPTRRGENRVQEEYDPRRDGEDGAVIGSSSSSMRYEAAKSTRPGLDPKE